MSEIYAVKSQKITERERKHMKLSRMVAAECIVLLENNGTLPLEKRINIALYGNGARFTVKGGTGSGDVNSRLSVTIEQGLVEAGYRITTESWLDRYDKKREITLQKYNQWVKEKAVKAGVPEFVIGFDYPMREPEPELITMQDIEMSDTDTAIYVISRNSGEGADRTNEEGDYQPSQEELQNLSVLGKEYKNIILVLNIGGVMDLSKIRSIEGIGAVVLMSQLGNIGGNALADILDGDVTPSGKLTDTWAKNYYDYPSSHTFGRNNGNVDDEYYSEGVYTGYRYFDAFKVEPLYCFGFGRSYTSFTIQTMQVQQVGNDIEITVTVKNTGKQYAGKEVVQVYYSAPDGAIEKPYQELAAYRKSKLLAPGESEQLRIAFPITDMASYSESDASWILEKGNYILRVGNSSRNTNAAAVLKLDCSVVTQALKNLFAADGVTEKMEKPAISMDNDLEQTCMAVKLKTENITTTKAAYQDKRDVYMASQKGVLTMSDIQSGNCTVEELTSQLTVEELTDLCIGSFREDGTKEQSIIGNAGESIPGAAGETSSILKKSRGIRNLVMADGPAGLRLEQQFTAGNENYYQYCTAIPIGWALAQSWNTELIERIGDMVGQEMEQFHIDIWLAPALNIHRNPLCGRNFEYYSEDPLVSGKTAAAVTKGVQSHHGKGVAVKHLAANNQEDNRYFTNAHVSERALREIYLKGFEIAVKEAHPVSIMTSYNLINGVHTANHRSLLQTVVREEWEFCGVIMTDWFASQSIPAMTKEDRAKHPISASTGCIYAGNDIQMPGCKKNAEDILKAVRTGKEIDGYKITLADLQFCAANVIRVVAGMEEHSYEMLNKKAVIFDLDGVICFTDQFHYQAWKALTDRLGIYFDEKINDSLRGISRIASLEIILGQSNRKYTQEEKEAFAEEKNANYRELLKKMSPADLSEEVKDTLTELRNRGYKLGIASSSKNTMFILERLGLDTFFDAVADGTEIIYSKPDPEVFLTAAGKLGVSPSDCYVVEDAKAGIEAAKAGGMTALALFGDARNCGVEDYNLSSFEDILNALEQI